MSSELLTRGYFKLAFIKRLFADHRSKRADTSLQIWTLYNLTAWYDYWIGNKVAVRA
jgi:asparagine synthase (glutamine-hydrolysing)